MARTWPLLFFTFFNFLRKYLNQLFDQTTNIKIHKEIKHHLNIKHTEKQKQKNKKKKKKIPKLGLGPDLVGSPKLHPINLRMLIRRRGQRPPDYLILVKLRHKNIKFVTKSQGINQVRSHLKNKLDDKLFKCDHPKAGKQCKSPNWEEGDTL